MAFRFRRSIRIAPGIRVNLSRSGMSLSAGIKGASVTTGRQGTYLNMGLPGTGISMRQRLDRRARNQATRTGAGKALGWISATVVFGLIVFGLLTGG